MKKLAASVREANLTLSAGQCGQAKSREKKVSSVTLTLVIVSITFIILCLPFSLYILLTDFVLDKIPGKNVFSRSLKELVYEIINWLWCWNSAVNFYLYCLTGSKFRTECLRVLTFNRFPRRKQNAANNSHLTHFSYANSTNSNTVSYANFDFWAMGEKKKKNKKFMYCKPPALRNRQSGWIPGQRTFLVRL